MNSKSSNNIAGGLIPQILSSFTALSDKNAILSCDTTLFLRPWLTGTAEPNSIVNIQVNAQPIGQVNSDKTGQWTFELPLQANAEKFFTVSSKETGATSAPFTITLVPELQLNKDRKSYSLKNEPLLPVPDVPAACGGFFCRINDKRVKGKGCFAY
ncbi:Ig-like domain-containing protein (plasmid) [Pantoea sp. C3]|uniref:Ig-like domain-containing protein n=1 Tax=Pantoea phytostimulans TaxID=2769024 RepID=UPI0038F68799